MTLRTPTRIAAIALLLLLARAVQADEDQFRARIQPLLEQRCLRCHGGVEPKGGLSLATREGLLAGGENGPAASVGEPEGSLLLAKISGDKPEMPQQGKPLSSDELAFISQWIKDGLPWPADLTLVDRHLEGETWWSLQPLVRPAVPPSDSNWARTPIDAFILAAMEPIGLAPSPEADRRTLIRRLTYDLHGLPPTPREVDDFLADPSSDAYEALVDRLLESPRYGERWGRHWLDVVHYGESHGYDKDKPRPNAWPYRDYVIRSLNADKPYSQFVREQLAGDALQPAPADGMAAIGFVAAGPWDFVGHVELREGTIDKLITRANDRDDMLMTTMSTFLSLTVHCARCHDHKFDPIPQADYYRLQATFAGVDRADQPYFPDPETQRQWQDLSALRAGLQQRLEQAEQVAATVQTPEIHALDQELASATDRLKALPTGDAGPKSPSNGYHSLIEPGPDVEKWVQVDLGQSLAIDEIRLVPARPVDFPDTPGFGFPSRYRVELSDDAEFAAPMTLADRTTADVDNPGETDVTVAATGNTARYVRVRATRLWKRTEDFVFALAELQVWSNGKNVALAQPVTALDSIEAGLWSKSHLVDGYSSRELLADPAARAQLLAERKALTESVQELQARRQQLRLNEVDAATRQELSTLPPEIAEVDRSLAELPPKQLVYSLANIEPRPVNLLNRGSVRDPGPLMSPGALSCLPGLPAEFNLQEAVDGRTRRLALAHWLTNENNGLLRRSIVNRVWHYHFGRGLVDTPNDFGHMGSLPSHPELLDWLACEFSNQGESLKSLHRLILLSAVYRQTSANDPARSSVDSANRFLWRMNRTRLDAESTRDTVLAVTGKLDSTMFGPSVQQYQFKDDHSPIYDYDKFDVDDPRSFRRSVYRFLVRSVPDPFFECLDCPDASILTPKRNTTLTALQALALLNDRFMVRQSQHFAARLQSESQDLESQVSLACRLTWSREPSREESRRLVEFASRHGLANTCRLLFNSNEFVFID